ncbi:MAG TPA: CapA family protein [Desulfuromonadales bacterium]|nr:CapA family protein [Desulfuromonadales bacterium]
MRILPRYVLVLIFCLQLAAQSAVAAEIVINAAGDIMLAGRWAPVLKRKGFGSSFDGVRKELSGADISLANLEFPLANRGTEFLTKKFRFKGEPDVAVALREAGFNLVTLANNHSMDFGGVALKETLRHLESAGIAWIGAGENLDEARKMALYTLKGKKIAFLGYSLTQPVEFFADTDRPGTTPGYEKLVIADVASARRQADVVIVTFHWGKEADVTVQNYQKIIARKAVDAGADVIIGHHPHILQGIERYRNSLIFYSLGNFVFASKSVTADVSALVRLRFDDSRRRAEIIPLDVLHRRVGFQPKVLYGERGNEVIGRLNDLSREFKTTVIHSDGKFILEF